ncbi:DUF2231 domain-containing protein [Clavibacter tessellarius]|uniref:DUF2231 domain-containing protein n=1 Tax=Clavibacter tessellarius TaxID=31965 RepID=UPI003249A1F8
MSVAASDPPARPCHCSPAGVAWEQSADGGAPTDGDPMRELKLVAAIAKIEDAEALDPIVDRVKGVVTAMLKPRALADLLHGVPFGHPLHPVAVLIPTGAWVSSAVLDVLPGNAKASQALVGVGILSAAPSIVSGYADWSQLHEQQMRVGIVHSAANALATGLYGLSWIQRARGKQTSGKVLGLAGLGLVSAGGFLGGHLAYRQAAGANHAEDVPHRFPAGWQEARAARRPARRPPSQARRRGPAGARAPPRHDRRRAERHLQPPLRTPPRGRGSAPTRRPGRRASRARGTTASSA